MNYDCIYENVAARVKKVGLQGVNFLDTQLPLLLGFLVHCVELFELPYPVDLLRAGIAVHARHVVVSVLVQRVIGNEDTLGVG